MSNVPEKAKARFAADMRAQMFSITKKIKERLSNETERHEFVRTQLARLPSGYLLLDAGCGSQQYRVYCTHLSYKAQDFGQYVVDESDGFTSNMGGEAGYKYGRIDYIGNIWSIPEEDGYFDAILCTEVFEHIPFPNETVAEFSRLLKPGGVLILTVPSNCLRHMDPYYFYTGFSDRYLIKLLSDSGFDIDQISSVGDYYSWIAVELARTMRSHGFISRAILGPALIWYMSRKKTAASVSTLCMGYHVRATKRLAP